MRPKNISFIILSIILACVAFLASYCLRILPAKDTIVEFKFDRAFNYRMTTYAINLGEIPVKDPLSTYPEGKIIRNFLPLGMYYMCSTFVKTLRFFTNIDTGRLVLWFCALFGSLIFIPVYFISFEIYCSRPIAYVTAFLSSIVPAYLHRTLCYWYRYEIVGAPILFFSLFFFMKIFGASDTRKTLKFSILSVLFLVLAFSVWRLSILFLIAYIIAFVYILILKGKIAKDRWLALGVIVGLSLIFIKIIPGFTGKGLFKSYGDFPIGVLQIILHNLGIKQNFSDFTRLIVANRELQGVTLPQLFNMKFLSYSGVFVFAYIVLYFKNKSRTAQKDILTVFLIFFLALTLLFLRNKIFLGPLTAIALGASLDFVLKNKQKLKIILHLLVAIVLIKTSFDAWKLSTTRKMGTKLNVNLKEALITINETTPKNSVILCYWSDGYVIQTYTSKPTLTDGLLESPEITKRIISLSKIYYLGTEEELSKYCKRFGATYLLVPYGRKKSYAAYSGVDINDYFKKDGPTKKGEKTLLYKLLYRIEEVKKFSFMYSNEDYVLYNVK